MSSEATLRDVLLIVREDEAGHRDRNHHFTDELRHGKQPTGQLVAAE